MNILKEARKATKGRKDSYGHPADHFRRTVLMVTGYLKARGLLREDANLEWFDWPNIMDLDKIARGMETGFRHRDSLVDRAGYVRTIEMGLERNGNSD